VDYRVRENLLDDAVDRLLPRGRWLRRSGRLWRLRLLVGLRGQSALPVAPGLAGFDSDLDSFFEPEVAEVSADDELVSEEEGAAGALSADLELVLDLSFFAHPLPLKTIAGVFSSLRIGPPHFSHAVGPAPFTPWSTSTRWPQLRHS
jgi:hypothetical protein